MILQQRIMSKVSHMPVLFWWAGRHYSKSSIYKLPTMIRDEWPHGFSLAYKNSLWTWNKSYQSTTLVAGWSDLMGIFFFLRFCVSRCLIVFTVSSVGVKSAVTSKDTRLCEGNAVKSLSFWTKSLFIMWCLVHPTKDSGGEFSCLLGDTANTESNRSKDELIQFYLLDLSP